MEGADITGRLADFIVGTTYADLTADAVSAAKRMFLDLLGCGIAGTFYAAGEIRPVVKIAAELGGREECTLLAGGRKSSWFNAVLVNGACMHSIDYDDTRPGPITHTGAVVVPATLAFCEKLQRSGKDAILNAVLAYEAVSRIGTSVMPSHYDFWHSTGTNGTFGGTVAAGKLLALNAAQMETALGIAADQAAVENAQATLGYTTITAPISGRTGLLNVDEGNYVRASDSSSAIVTVSQIKPIAVLFNLPQQDLDRVNAAFAKGPLPVEAQRPSTGAVIARGKLTVIDNEVDSTTGTVKLKAQFPNPDLKLWPGQFVNVRLLIVHFEECRHRSHGLRAARSERRLRLCGRQ